MFKRVHFCFFPLVFLSVSLNYEQRGDSIFLWLSARMSQGFMLLLFSLDRGRSFRLAIMNSFNGQKAINYLRMRGSFQLAIEKLAYRPNFQLAVSLS